MSQEQDIESSVRHLLNDLTIRTAAFVLTTTVNYGKKFDRKARLQLIIKSTNRLRQIQAMHPTKATAVIRRYKQDVADAHEALMDVSDRFGARTQPQVINLATEIRNLFQPAKITVLVPDELG